MTTRAADGPNIEVLSTPVGVVKVEDGAVLGLSDDGWFEMRRCWDSSTIDVEAIAGVTGAEAPRVDADLVAIDFYGDAYVLTARNTMSTGTACWRTRMPENRVFADKEVPFAYRAEGSISEGYKPRLTLGVGSNGGNVASVQLEWALYDADGFVADWSENVPYAQQIRPELPPEQDARGTAAAVRFRFELEDGGFSSWSPAVLANMANGPALEDVATHFGGGDAYAALASISRSYEPPPQ